MIPSFLLQKENIQPTNIAESNKQSFIDNTINNAAAFVSATFLQWQSSKRNGFLQLLDSRVKVIFMLLYAVLISITTSIACQGMIAFIIFLLCLFSKLNILHIYKRVMVAGFLFGFLVFIPASLNIFTKGEKLFNIIHFSQPHSWWLYNIPQDIYVTYEGLQIVLRLTLKVVNSVSIVLIIISATTFERLVKSLSFFKIPDIFLLTLTLTYKFIFILSNTVVETYHAIKMRWWNRGTVLEAEEIVAGRIGYLFRRAWERYELVYLSMTARGFNGKVNFCYFDKLKVADYLFIGAFLIVFSILLIINYFHARTI